MTHKQIAMQLIINAGNAKTLAFDAISLAKTGNYEAANEKLADAKKTLVQAHQIQTDALKVDAQALNEVGLLMVHAQDHLSMATTTIELGQEIIELYQRVGRKHEQ